MKILLQKKNGLSTSLLITIYLTLSDSASGKTLWPGGGGIMAPPRFFSFGPTKSPKLNFGTFLALKTTWKAILNISRFLSLVARGQEISIDIIVEKFKIFKILSFKGVMRLKWKLRTFTIQIELEKVGFVCKKINFFKVFWFLPNAHETWWK